MQTPISADSHIVESPEVFRGLADRFGDAAPRIAATPHEGEGLVVPAEDRGAIGAGRVGIAGRRLDAGRVFERRPGHKPSPEDPKDPEVRGWIQEGYGGIRKGIVDPAQRHADQDVDGVGAEVLYPSFFFRVFGMQNTELVTAAFRNYNDWIVDYESQARDRLVGLALLPLHDPEAGARELERVLDKGIRGACIPCTAPEGRPYRDPAYEGIWARAEEAGIPLSMHIGTGASAGSWETLVQSAISGYASAPQAAQDTVCELICQGVAHRHPGLRFVVTEFNAGWIPTWLERLDQGYERTPSAAADELDRLPSEYWGRQFFATFEDDRAAVLTRTLIGVQCLLWGNDYPHRDSTWPASQALLDELFEGVDEADRAAMTHGNVAALYGLGA